MKIRLSELAVGTCFRQGRTTRKKVEDGKAVSLGSGRRVLTRTIKGDPEVEPVFCPLRLFGVGLRNNPETVVEIGDGNILKRRKR